MRNVSSGILFYMKNNFWLRRSLIYIGHWEPAKYIGVMHCLFAEFLYPLLGKGVDL